MTSPTSGPSEPVYKEINVDHMIEALNIANQREKSDTGKASGHQYVVISGTQVTLSKSKAKGSRMRDIAGQVTNLATLAKSDSISSEQLETLQRSFTQLKAHHEAKVSSFVGKLIARWRGDTAAISTAEGALNAAISQKRQEEQAKASSAKKPVVATTTKSTEKTALSALASQTGYITRQDIADKIVSDMFGDSFQGPSNQDKQKAILSFKEKLITQMLDLQPNALKKSTPNIQTKQKELRQFAVDELKYAGVLDYKKLAILTSDDLEKVLTKFSKQK